MNKVGQEIPEFGVKNMQPGSKASPARRASAAKPDPGNKEPSRRGGPSKAGSGAGRHGEAKK